MAYRPGYLTCSLLLLSVAWRAAAAPSTSAAASVPVNGPSATTLSLEAPAPAPDATRISLAHAVQRALSRNKALSVRKLEPDLALARVLVEEGVFDHVVALERGALRTELPTGSQLEGADVAVRDVETTQVGVRRRFRAGTEAALAFNDQKLETNSRFQFLNPQHTSNLVTRITQPLARGVGERTQTAGLRIALNGKQQGDLRLRKQILDTVAAVERQYWDLVFARQDREVRRFALAAAADLRRFNQRRQEMGLGAEVEVLEARTTEATREADLELSSRVVSDAEEILRRLLALDDARPGSEIVPTETLPALPRAVPLVRALRTAYERRPDHRDLVLELKNRRIDVEFLKNQRLPRVDLAASYARNGVAGTFADSVDQVAEGRFPTYFVGVQLEIPLENREARGRYRIGQLQVRQALLSLRALEDQIEEEVSRSVRALDTDLRRVELTRRAAELAAEQVRKAESRFREGLIPNIDLLRFQQDLANARSLALRAVVEAVKDGISIEAATGVLLDARRIRVDRFPVAADLEAKPGPTGL